MNVNSEQNDIHRSPGYEKKDINIGKTVLLTVATILFIVISLIVLNETFLMYKEEIVKEMVLMPQSATLAEVRATQDSLLSNYSVSQDSAGVQYRIPIEEAMKIVADEAAKQQK